jgi:tetratricopeptide (TPR) repeat protein
MALVFTVAAPALGCLWDYDTLRDEKRGLPGMAEVLAGQWERHSRFFYQHRVAAMTAKLAARSDDWDAMDNLAVAHAKLDELDAAIAVMLDKEKRHPGQYTTASNLGTFYMFKGDLPAAIAQLKRALAINPNAHFGREEYQLRLAEFLIRANADPNAECDDFLHLRRTATDGFWGSKPATQSTTEPTTNPYDGEFIDEPFKIGFYHGRMEELGVKPNVFDGLVGMIRFGTTNSPELYFALGDLLALRGDKNLAVRAYQRALDTHHPQPAVVRRMIDAAGEMEVPRGGLDPAVIAAERAAAEGWVAEYQQFEDDLVRSGKDTDDENNYAPFYAAHGRTLSTPDSFPGDFAASHPGVGREQVAGAVGLLAIAGLIVARLVRHRRRRALLPRPE